MAENSYKRKQGDTGECIFFMIWGHANTKGKKICHNEIFDLMKK